MIDASFNDGKGLQASGKEFMWPHCPMKDGRTSDLRVFTDEDVSAGFTSHLMDTAKEQAYFMAWSPRSKVLFGYVWRRADFPWLARWEENHLRNEPPWNSRGLACGMEFGVSPIVESRRQMVERGSLFGVPGFQWIPARTTIKKSYTAFVATADSMPESNLQEKLAAIHSKQHQPENE